MPQLGYIGRPQILGVPSSAYRSPFYIENWPQIRHTRSWDHECTYLQSGQYSNWSLKIL